MVVMNIFNNTYNDLQYINFINYKAIVDLVLFKFIIYFIIIVTIFPMLCIVRVLSVCKLLFFYSSGVPSRRCSIF